MRVLYIRDPTAGPRLSRLAPPRLAPRRHTPSRLSSQGMRLPKICRRQWSSTARSGACDAGLTPPRGSGVSPLCVLQSDPAQRAGRLSKTRSRQSPRRSGAVTRKGRSEAQEPPSGGLTTTRRRGPPWRETICDSHSSSARLSRRSDISGSGRGAPDALGERVYGAAADALGGAEPAAFFCERDRARPFKRSCLPIGSTRRDAERLMAN